MLKFLIASLALLVPLAPVSGQFTLTDQTSSSKAELLSEAKSVAPGSAFTVALKLDHPDGWHSYYRNSGGVELPPSITWKLPEGFKAGAIQWPTPESKDGFFGKSFIYPGSPVFLVDITAPPTLEAGTTVTLQADAFWQICEDACINEDRSLTLTLPVTAETEADPAMAEIFARARASQPLPSGDWNMSAQTHGPDILLRIDPGATFDGEITDFIPNQPFLRSAQEGGSIKRDGSAWLIQLKRALKDPIDEDKEIPQGDSFSGVLIGTHAVAVPDTEIHSPEKSAGQLPNVDFLSILGGMFLGGMLLNLMPCVFPVIGLKIMGFVQQAGSHREKIVLHGLVFTLGVFASFGVLSAILFAARTSIGWGYQLQNPWFICILMLLMFVLALNMFGLFEIGASAPSIGGSLQSKQGFTGSFFSGVLATVVATPCSGPFLGVAMAAAFVLPALQFFSSFAAMAAGLALPYLLLSAFPRLIERLPRPGAWMETFKQSMSFLLFATAGFLLWVYGGLIDFDNLLSPILGLTAIAIAAWIHGRWNLPHRNHGVRVTALLLTLAFAATGYILVKPPKPSALVWEPWSQARVEEVLAQGDPVYIDFTAQWCATCLVNKKRAYTTEVIDLMKKKRVVAFKADKTRPNPEIEAAIQGFGRRAIPVNVLLAPNTQPQVFPELLSPTDLIQALENL